MPKLLLIFIFFLFSNISLASDDKPGRFFEDQPDVNDDYQIHFIYNYIYGEYDYYISLSGFIIKLLELNEIEYSRVIIDKIAKNINLIIEKMVN